MVSLDRHTSGTDLSENFRRAVYMSYCNCWDYLLLHENWGECSEDWAGACRWGGGGGVEYLTENFFSLRNVPGVLKRKKKKKKFGGGILGCLGRPTPPPGGRAGSENNTLLPMTMTCDRLKFWSGPAWRSKVIIRKPWRRKKKKKKKFWQNHKAFPACRRECLISCLLPIILTGFMEITEITVNWKKYYESLLNSVANCPEKNMYMKNWEHWSMMTKCWLEILRCIESPPNFSNVKL